MSENLCLEPLLKRRSVRVYEDREVPMDLILKILDIARWAPSARNAQPWEFVVVNDRKILEELSKIHFGAEPLSKAPAAVVVLCDTNISPTTYLVDCANAALYIMLAAYCMGLGTVWINSLRNIEEVRKIIKAPSSKVPVAIIAIGYPAEKPKIKPRKPLNQLVHIGTYGNKLSQT